MGGSSVSTFLNQSPVFGPVTSRRFGVSLGVNLMPATGKICTFDCLYCENGFDDQRRTHDGYVTLDQVTSALTQTLEAMAEKGEQLDDICFAGNGEPTASPIFPAAVDAALALRNRYAPMAHVTVLSNSTQAARPDVHDALLRVDRNVLKLDTVDAAYVAALDRPRVPYDVERQVEVFASFKGHVIVQTIFLRGSYMGHSFDNTDDAHVEAWLLALRRIQPEGVTIYTVDRDTPAPGLAKAPRETLDAIAQRVRKLGIPCTVGY